MKNSVRIPAELHDIAPEYLASRKRDLPHLKDALIRKDFAFLLKFSHRTKGTAGGYGFTELGELAKLLETAVKSENDAAIESALEALRSHLGTLEIMT